MTYVQFVKIRHTTDQPDVCVINAMPCIYLHTPLICILGSLANPGQLTGLRRARDIGECTGVEFDCFHLKVSGRVDLFEVRFNEKTYPDSGAVEALDSGLQDFDLCGGIQAPLGGDFATVLGHHANVFRKDTERDFQNLASITHLQVQLGVDAFAEPENVPILHVPAIRPQMHCDSMSPRPLTRRGGRHQIRLAVRRIDRPCITRLPQRGDVIDVYPKAKIVHGLLYFPRQCLK